MSSLLPPAIVGAISSFLYTFFFMQRNHQQVNSFIGSSLILLWVVILLPTFAGAFVGRAVGVFCSFIFRKLNVTNNHIKTISPLIITPLIITALVVLFLALNLL